MALTLNGSSCCTLWIDIVLELSVEFLFTVINANDISIAKAAIMIDILDFMISLF